MTDTTARSGDGVRRCQGDQGAAAVEFALVAPVLFLILFGFIEFGWWFAQDLDIRHGAREGSRLTAVGFANGSGNAIATETCSRMSLATGVTVTVDFNGATRGSVANVEVSETYNSLSGFFGPMLDGKSITSSVDTRLERNLTTVTDGSAVCA